jgi:fructokinase
MDATASVSTRYGDRPGPGVIVCLGELLWDSLPLGLFLGGAPFNVACHLHTLGRDVAVVSRVGDDALGHEALRRLHVRGVSTELVQIDESLPTGFVEVTLDAAGVPEYVIVEPAAWDAIETKLSAKARIDTASAVVFGTLAQRSPASREAVRTLVQVPGLKVLDLNLRPPFDAPEVIKWSLEAADVLKLSDEELVHLQSLLGLPARADEALEALASRYALKAACVTRGARGALLWQEGEVFEHGGYHVEVQDTVGAGDAFLAAFLVGLLQDVKGEPLLRYANHLGAYVASRLGGTPEYQVHSLDDVMNLPLPQPHPI